MFKKIWIGFLFFAAKGLTSIRYRVRIRGVDALTPEVLSKPGGVLFLPNHPAEIDPIIIILALWRFRPRPIVVEHFFYIAVGHYFMTLIGALPLPDLNGMVNKWKQKKIEKLFAYVSEELKNGENFLIYPSGKLKVSAAEIIGGASFVHNLLKECPNANVVMIRTTGLWGSRFSRAITGTTPDFAKAAWEGVKLVLKNGIFLTPRRDVTIEVQAAPTDFPYTGTRLELNQYLEKWYNVHGPEPLKLVSDYFWKKQYPTIAASEKTEIGEAVAAVSPELEKTVIAKIAELTKRQPQDIQRSQHLSRDLGLDSLDVAQLYVFLDERYDVGGLIPGQLQTVEDVLKAAAGQKEKFREPSEEKPIKAAWPLEQSRPAISVPQGKTVQEAFLRICDRMDGYAACADAIYGIMTYRRLKLAALTLAGKLRHIDGKYIGVLLPSSSAAYLLICAILLAKKVPVMLNWTVGVKALDHSVKMTDLKVVLSSRRFLNNLNNGDLGIVDDLLVLLEDLREEITLGHKAAALYGLLKDTDTLLEDLKLIDIDPKEPAVVLFTSGTEALPKGVPLSHTNLIANQTAALSCVDFQAKDILYGVLPPFHSFGFSVTGLLPILAGMRAYYSPDPNNSHGMARDIADWKVTLFCCAPTFMKGLFHVASPKQLESLQYIVSGAEKAPQELIEFVEKLSGNKIFIEGYGITECGPMVTITLPGKSRLGVGTPLPGVEICVIDTESGALLSQGKEGEVCIRGPNVFAGYLGGQKSPFITLNGKEWYRSGDRGALAENGALVLSGRLKRFVKIGGEMVSLGGLEEELLRLAHELKWPIPTEIEGYPLAIGVKERESEKPEIILFTIFDIAKEDVNIALRKSGYGNIVKISEVRKLEQIPLTGTGKTHYRALDEMLR